MELAAGTVKKISLELGGKSPSIVLADCDLEAAVGGIMSSIFMNQGQMCTAGSRLLLEESIYDEFMKLLVEKTKVLKIGNALDYQTEFGPVISKEQQQKALKAFGFLWKGKPMQFSTKQGKAIQTPEMKVWKKYWLRRKRGGKV